MHVAERFERLLEAHPRPDGRPWTGAGLERATGGVVTRSYVTNLRKGKIESPGHDKMGAIAMAIGFPPSPWFDDAEGRVLDAALAAMLEEETAREILEEVLGMGPRDRRLLLGIARQISRPRQER